VFGTSGHRGSALDNAFNEAHILAITQAICLYRKQQGIDGPLYIGVDTHALSEPAFASALEVLVANRVDVMVDADNTGTHDNPTSREWYEELPSYQRQNLWGYLKSPEGEGGQVAWDLIRLAWSSVAGLAVAPLQDLVNLGPETRMNVPGRPEGNWTWRCTEEMLSAPAFHSLRELTSGSNRAGHLSPLTSEMTEAAS